MGVSHNTCGGLAKVSADGGHYATVCPEATAITLLEIYTLRGNPAHIYAYILHPAKILDKQASETLKDNKQNVWPFVRKNSIDSMTACRKHARRDSLTFIFFIETKLGREPLVVCQ